MKHTMKDLAEQIIALNYRLKKTEANHIAKGFVQILNLVEREKLTPKIEGEKILLEWGTGGAKINLFNEVEEFVRLDNKYELITRKEENIYNNRVLRPLLVPQTAEKI